VKDAVYVPPLPTTFLETVRKLEAAVAAVAPTMVTNVWTELEYGCAKLLIVPTEHL
jgi:hypothetical protein